MSMLSKQLDFAVHLLATQLIQESPACLSLLIYLEKIKSVTVISRKISS